jgi:hypothetical protein
MRRLVLLVMFLATCHMVGTVIGLALAASPHRPKDYRITLYDGGQVICAWKTADYFNAKGGGIVFNTDKGSVCIRGTYIIEQVPARTKVR